MEGFLFIAFILILLFIANLFEGEENENDKR